MTPDRNETTARRYLLREMDEAERERLERDYFADEAALDRMEAAEEALIEDYLADRLPRDSRNRFERVFLSRPDRRARVQTIRALTAAGARGAATRRTVPALARRAVMWAAAAAAAVVLAVAGWRGVGDLRDRQATSAAARPVPAPAPAPRPVKVFAVTLSAAGTRSSGITVPIVVPGGTDDVLIRLAAEPGEAAMERGRAVVRKVAGEEVWRGAAAPPADHAADVAASIVVPASRLRPDDYLVLLFAVTSDGAEREAARFFLRIAAR